MRKKIIITIVAFSWLLLSMISCKRFEYTVPEVSTGNIKAIFGGAYCENILTSDGGSYLSARGICFSTQTNPTLADIVCKDQYYHDDSTSHKFLITNLQPGTTYYARAFATNPSGTGYGESVEFTTVGYNDSLTDIEGNVYHTIIIGTQEWMVENLNTLHYRNEDPIPNVTNNNAWLSLTTGAYCDYDNNPGNSDIYGKLYNWYAVNDSRNLAPQGWHVATQSDWGTLISYLGSGETACNSLMESGTLHWDTPSIEVTNESGFTALPGGGRYSYYFDYLRYYAKWWCASEFSSADAWLVSLTRGGYYYNENQINILYSSKNSGYSVRCVKD